MKLMSSAWRPARISPIVLTVIEEAVVGLFHGRSIAASLDDLADRRLEEALARSLITLLVLISYFAFRVLGDGRRTLFVARGLGA
jgi:hypothetical protein